MKKIFLVLGLLFLPLSQISAQTVTQDSVKKCVKNIKNKNWFTQKAIDSLEKREWIKKHCKDSLDKVAKSKGNWF